MVVSARSIASPGITGRIIDTGVTLACWTYFTLGYILFFAVRYAVYSWFPAQREFRFQSLNCRFYRGFFGLLRMLVPRHRWRIDPEVTALRSAVLVCNHVSYLDPLLFISLFEKQKTVVKTTFFKVPIFGWVLRHSGYFPAGGDDRFGGLMIDQVERLGTFLAGGGNFFIFPEGTRSRDGRIGPLNRGALKIARLSRAPIVVLQLTNTDKLFAPGRFLFTTRTANEISLSVIALLDADTVQRLKPAELERVIGDAWSVSRQQASCRRNPPDLTQTTGDRPVTEP